MPDEMAWDRTSVAEDAPWVSETKTLLDHVLIPWPEPLGFFKRPGSATEMVPSLEVRLGDEWARAIRPADIRRHATRVWFDACATHGYDVLRQTVDIDPHIRGGVPVLKGTGFTVAQAIAELADGDAVEKLANRFALEEDVLREMLFALALLFQRPCQR